MRKPSSASLASAAAAGSESALAWIRQIGSPAAALSPTGCVDPAASFFDGIEATDRSLGLRTPTPTFRLTPCKILSAVNPTIF